MDISAGLIAKGTLGAGALAAAAGTSYVYRDEIGDFISPLWAKEHERINKKLSALKIEEAGCKFAENDSSKECDLDETKFKSVNFAIKEGGEAAVTGLSTDKKVTLKIEKVEGGSEFPGNLKFTLTSKTADSVEIKKSGNDNNKITLKKDSDYEFKLSSDGSKLEKAWTISTLGSRTGLFTCEGSSINGNTTGECTLSTEINVWKSSDDYITGGKTPNGGTERKISFAKDSGGYYEGFKFTVKTDISLSDGIKKKTDGSGVDKLINNNMSYELEIKDTDNGKKWFFIEKSTAS